MTTVPDGKIPLCLVTGFLGSGKTTLLKHIVEKHREQRLVYLVNEFSPHDIDGAIVAEDNPAVVAIPGGSIFCKCLVSEFIARLTEVPAKFGDVEGVIVEASGMADPRVIKTMLRETGLDQMYRLAEVISLVDPGSFLKLCRTLPNIVAQVEAAGLVIINKTDLHPPESVDETTSKVKAINPHAAVICCAFARVDIDLFVSARESGQMKGEYALCRDPHYNNFVVEIHRPIVLEQLKQQLNRVEDDLFRVKGYAPMKEGGTYCLNYTKSGFSAEPVVGKYKHVLVFVTTGKPSPALNDLLASL